MANRWHLYRSAEPKSGIKTAGALFAAFVVLAVVARLLCVDDHNNSALWPANAALVVALLVLPPRLGWLTCGACFLANVGINHLSAYRPAEDVSFAALNVFVSLMTAFLTRSLCGATINLARFNRLSMFACICFGSAGLEAIIGVLLQPYASGEERFESWLQWALCDGVSLLIATPALLLAVRNGRSQVACEARLTERVLLLAATLVLDVTAFCNGHTPIVLFVYPLLILTAFRSGPPAVLGSVLLTSVIAAAMTSHGYGPLVTLSRNGQVFDQDLMQIYLLSLFLAAVPANSALGEKNRAAFRLRRLKAAIEDDASYDALTTLLNRAAFRRRLATALAAGKVRAVLLIDLDRFKQVNDTMGHLAGDALLRSFAARLKQVVGEGAVAARLGGDEFAVMLGTSRPAGDVVAVCEAVVAAARMKLRLASGVADISASVGAMLVEGQTGLDELFRRADVALYTVKAAGRDSYRVFDRSLDASAHDDLRLTAELRSALQDGGGLVLHYQLKFDRAGMPVGVEALVRWQHPQLGLMPPARFIALAESSGLILQLGTWVLREALAFAGRWPALSVAINISPVQMRAPGFLAETLAAFQAAMTRPGQIELELTETALLEESHDAAETIASLRAAGLRIALDDFGTGYSSLGHLRSFRIDRLKIDRSFVLGLSDSPEAAAIIRAVIDLGHAVGLEVTAEGVETEAQRDHLLRAGVDELQGYLMARPVPEAALIAHAALRVAA